MLLHLIVECHQWHFNELFICFLLSDRGHFILNFFLSNFRRSYLRDLLWLRFSCLVALSSFSFIQFITNITVFFFFVFLIFCFRYITRFLNLFQFKWFLVYCHSFSRLLGHRHLVLIHVVIEQTWVKDRSCIITLDVELRNLILALIVYWNSASSQEGFRSFNLTTLFSWRCRVDHHASLSTFHHKIKIVSLHQQIIFQTIIINMVFIIIKIVNLLIIFVLILIHIFHVKLRKCGTYLFSTYLSLGSIVLTKWSVLMVWNNVFFVRMSSEFSVFNAEGHCRI